EFVAKVLQQFGYHTKVGVVLEGKCVKHEIDILAEKDNSVYYIECKFHNRPGLKTDVQVALYTNARFKDIESNAVEVDHPKGVQPPQIHYSWLVSNTKITKDATNYANCQNMKLTSWNSPGKESLFHLVADSGLHPITALSSLSPDQVKILLKQNTVTLRDLTHLLKNNQLTGLLSKEVVKKIKAEINAIFP
ncbi:ATPase, partial [Patescibacteria group bacterium]|nr:ATPase [Patescibacteria group bacterium]